MTDLFSDINSLKVQLSAVERRIDRYLRILPLIHENLLTDLRCLVPLSVFGIVLWVSIAFIFWNFYEEAKVPGIVPISTLLVSGYFIRKAITLLIRSIRIYRCQERVKNRLRGLEETRHRLEEVVIGQN